MRIWFLRERFGMRLNLLTYAELSIFSFSA